MDPKGQQHQRQIAAAHLAIAIQILHAVGLSVYT